MKYKEKTMQEITTEQIRMWIGSDRQNPSDYLELLYELVNGEYTAEQMRKDIINSDLGE
jgi:hypothetical protein